MTEEGTLRFRWADVATLALERWTPREIARALQRAGCVHVLPPLNQVRAITVELPVYQIRLLHYLAEQRSPEDRAPRSISDILEYELAAMATEIAAEMEERLPGFTLAALFPKWWNVRASVLPMGVFDTAICSSFRHQPS